MFIAAIRGRPGLRSIQTLKDRNSDRLVGLATPGRTTPGGATLVPAASLTAPPARLGD